MQFMPTYSFWYRHNLPIVVSKSIKLVKNEGSVSFLVNLPESPCCPYRTAIGGVLRKATQLAAGKCQLDYIVKITYHKTVKLERFSNFPQAGDGKSLRVTPPFEQPLTLAFNYFITLTGRGFQSFSIQDGNSTTAIANRSLLLKSTCHCRNSGTART